MSVTPADAPSRDQIVSLLARLWQDRKAPPGVFAPGNLTEDAIWRFLGWPDSLLAGPRTFQGWSEIEHAARMIDACVEVTDSEVIDTIVEGSEAALLRRLHVQHRATGATGALTVHDLVSFRGGKIAAYLQFLDTDAFASILRGERQTPFSLAANRSSLAEHVARRGATGGGDADPSLREARRRRIRDFIAARHEEGSRSFLHHCTEDFRMHVVGDVGRVPFARWHEGRVAAMEIVDMIDREFAHLAVQIRSILVEGDRAAMHYVNDVRHRGTSSVGRSEALIHFTFRGDRLRSMTVYFDTARTINLIEGTG
jgi:ketosteroid isomerase-like protein